MMKLRIPMTLGLSATPERKDKLESIIYYFLGDIIYKGNTNNGDKVNVRIFNFELNNF